MPSVRRGQDLVCVCRACGGQWLVARECWALPLHVPAAQVWLALARVISHCTLSTPAPLFLLFLGLSSKCPLLGPHRPGGVFLLCL